MNLSFLSSAKTSFKGKTGGKPGETPNLNIDQIPQSARSGEDDSYTATTPRSIGTKDEFDDPDLDDLMDGKGGEPSFLAVMNRFMNKQAKAFVRNFVDYGPPYTRKPFDASLVNECSKPVINHMELHKLLNNRLDPNIADPEDLYYFPIHWCARNIHFMAMKMLCRAGAKLNVTNELGCSPLDMCVMMKLPPDKRKDQLKMTLYLLENGADPNNRTKSGQCAIDFAAVNQDLEIIQMLLEFGANVLRENYTLVAKRQHILRNVYDPECYRVLYERLLIEQEIAEHKAMLRERMRAEVVAERQHVKLHQSLDKRKQKRLAREAARDDSARLETVMAQRHKHLQEEMEANLQTKERAQQQQGLWVKEGGDNWTYLVKGGADRINASTVYAENKHMMSSLRELNHIDRYNERWKKATGHQGGLELHWTRADAFTLLPPIPGTPAFTGPYGAQAVGKGDDASSQSSVGQRGAGKSNAGSRGGGGSKGSDAARETATQQQQPPASVAAEQLQLEHSRGGGGSRQQQKDGNSKGGILKGGAHSRVGGESAQLEKHAFGGMFVASAGTTATTAAVGGSKSSSSAGEGIKVVKRQPGSVSDKLREHAHLPIVDAQYADSDDEQLYDEDLDAMFRELTTF